MLSPRARPLRARLGIEEFPAEAVAELLGMRALCEAEDKHVGIVAAE
jgi:hypothetical protein